MKINTLYLVIFIAWLLAACSSQTALKMPETSLRFLGDTVQVNVTGQNIQPKVLDQLKREIKAQLIVAGFDIEEKESSTLLILNVNVKEFTPGNTALRLIISFGAGRGSLLYLAEYKNQEGNVLANMNGEERFTGLEVGFNHNYGAFTNLGGEETATTVLIKEAAKHIVELALNPEQK